MRVRQLKAVLGTLVVAVLGVPGASVADSRAEPSALWQTGFAAGQTASDCGRWKLDGNGFCVADDARNGLEVGVRFQTSEPLQITGVRIYRVDTATVKGSLWDPAGTLLARGSFAPSTGSRWQDMTFDEPVTIAPGTTYTASYHTPGTKYAFDYGYFAAAGRTVGPVTAIRSQDDDPNGVHCYDGAPCSGFPVRPYRDSTYWVTPLWQGLGGAAPPPVAGGPAPRVTTTTPAAGARRVKVGRSISATLSEPVRKASVGRSTVVLLRKGRPMPVRITVRYDDAGRRVVLNPEVALLPSTTYRVKITKGVRDVDGNGLDQDLAKAGRQSATWTFRTR